MYDQRGKHGKSKNLQSSNFRKMRTIKKFYHNPQIDKKKVQKILVKVTTPFVNFTFTQQRIKCASNLLLLITYINSS